MLGWLRLFFFVAALTSAFGLFRGFTLGFFSRTEIEFVIQFGVAMTSAPLLLPSVVLRDFSPPQVRYVEVAQANRTRELPQLVKTNRLGEDVGVLPIRRNIRKFNLRFILCDNTPLYESKSCLL